MAKKKSILLFTLLTWYVFSLTAEVSAVNLDHVRLRYKSLGTNEGLPHSTIRSFYQDNKGFIWIGTGNGLARYDGFNLTVYYSNIYSENSLGGNTVIKMLGDTLDGEEGIWVLTLDNISFFNLERKSFNRIPKNHLTEKVFFYNNLRDIFTLDNGDICLVALNGLFAIDIKNFNLYEPELTFTDNQTTYTSGINLGSHYYLGTSKGLIKYDPVSDSFDLLTQPDGALQGVSFSNVTTIVYNNNGRIYFGNSSGLYVLNHLTGTIDDIKLNSKEPLNEVRSLYYESGKRNLWIATYEKGIYLFNEDSGKLSKVTPEGTQLPENTSTVFVDSKQVLWVGHFQGGASLANLNEKPFFRVKNISEGYSRVYGIEILDSMNILIGADNDALLHFNRRDNSHRPLIPVSERAYSPQRSIIGPIYFEKQSKKLWVGGFSIGLIKADVVIKSDNELRLRNTKMITPESGTDSYLKGWSVRSICMDDNQKIWVGTLDGGITIFSLDGKVVPVGEAIQKLDEYFPRGIRQIFNPAQGWENILFISDFRGVHITDIITGESISVSQIIKSSEEKTALSWPVWSVYQQNENVFWLATANTGLIRLHLSDLRNDINRESLSVRVDSVRVFHASDNFPTNLLYRILPDSNNNLWISSESGLIKFSTTDYTFETFNRSNGLEQLEFHFGSAAADPQTGYLYFGGSDGITWFHPDSIHPDPIPPAPVITGMDLFAKSLLPGERLHKRFILKKDLPYTDTIILRNRQNVISLGLGAVKFSGFSGNRCAYLMEGFDKDWRFTSSGFEKVTYTNLNPGSYLFRLRAINADHIWSEEEDILVIKILPPWWRTPWAYLLWVTIFILMMDLFRRMVRMRERLKSEIKLQKVEIEKEKEIARKTHEVDQLKIRFFTNISHEFRTPLTLILGPLDHLVQTLPPREIVTEQIVMIRRNAQRLLRLINQLLDLQKLEKSSMNLSLVNDDIIPFIKNLFYSFESFARGKQIEYTLVQSIEKLVMPFDPDVIEKSLSNLLSNALKFTPSEGKVKLTLQTYHKTNKDRLYLKIIVEDSGQGIPASEKAKIFRPFYRYENLESAKIPGTGIGLSITRELIDLHKGKIRETGKEGTGGVFEVRLPAYTDAYKGYNIQREKTWHDVNVQVGENSGIAANIDHYQVSESASQDPSCKSKTVLVIDDNSDILHFLGTILKDSYNLLYAKDGKEGLTKAREHNPSLIISDVMMPHLSGLEMTEILKSEQETSHIPVILLTSRSSEGHELEGLRTGADDYVAKPFNKEILLARIQNVFASREKWIRRVTKEMDFTAADVSIADTDKEFLGKVKTVVQANLSNSEFTTEILAGEVGMSRTLLFKKLKGLLDETGGSFILSMRMKAAAEYLTKSDYNVSEICYMVGFSDPKYFTRVFKKYYNLTPTDYRDQNKDVN